MRFQYIQQAFLLGFLAVATISFVWLIQDFLLAVFWAIVLAIVFYPLQKKFLTWTGGRNSLASLFTTLTILLLVITPIAFLATLAVGESVDVYQRISAGNSAGTVPILDQISSVTQSLERYGIPTGDLETRLASLTREASSWIASHALSFGQGLASFVLQFFIMLYTLFFMLHDGVRWEKKLIEVLPLGDVRERRLFAKFAGTTRATMKGTFLIELMQGALGGVMFWIAGISAPVLWGSVMAFFSIIPALGPSIIWAPAGIILLVSGNVWQGVFVLIFGGIVISFSDNLVRPRLVGRDTEMPDVLILLSTLGGLSLFGITGFVLGPVIAAFFLAMWAMFQEDYQKELGENM